MPNFSCIELPSGRPSILDDAAITGRRFVCGGVNGDNPSYQKELAEARVEQRAAALEEYGPGVIGFLDQARQFEARVVAASEQGDFAEADKLRAEAQATYADWKRQRVVETAYAQHLDQLGDLPENGVSGSPSLRRARRAIWALRNEKAEAQNGRPSDSPLAHLQRSAELESP